MKLGSNNQFHKSPPQGPGLGKTDMNSALKSSFIRANVIISVTEGSPTDAVEVKLKRSTLGAGGRIFARLKVVNAVIRSPVAI